MNRDQTEATELTVPWDLPSARVAWSVFFDSGGIPQDLLVAGRYRLGPQLGTGSTGAVRLAHDEVLGREVALKRLADRECDVYSDVLREARAAARVRHHGVVQVHDVIAGEDGAWIVMEALPGQPMSTEIGERGRLPVHEVVQIGVELLSALEAIHDSDLVHRDVKPGNVQICGGDRVVITDFGLCSPRGVWGGLRAGEIAGSLPYLAPESIIDGSFGPPSDLYALGVTLYRAVEGRHPFDSHAPLTAEAVASRSLVRPRHAGALAAILDGLLELDPARRLEVGEARSRLRAMQPTPPVARAG